MYQSPFSTFGPFLIGTGVVLFIIGAIYMVSRVRSEQMHLSMKHALQGYFYLMTVISFVIFTFGLVSLLDVGESFVAGRDFSYGRSPMAYPVGPPPPAKIQPGDNTPPQTPTPEQIRQEQQAQLEANLKRQDQSMREELTQGIGMAFVGGVIWALHIWGRRRFNSVSDSFARGIRRSYLVVMLVIYAIMGITAITVAVSRVLRQYILSSIDPYSFVPSPGPMVAAAIVFVPVWIYFLRALISEMREKENDTKAAEIAKPA